MSTLDAPVATTPADLRDQLEHPTAEAVWSRAVEVFGGTEKAKSWMTSRRDIFDGRCPEQLVVTGDPSQLRLVLETLIQIDYGVFS
jgi:uncharacterized protein (DUF2384 family)